MRRLNLVSLIAMALGCLLAEPSSAQTIDARTIRKTPLFQSPSMTSAILDTIPAGRSITIRDAATRGYVAVSWNGKSGYVRLADVQRVPVMAEAAPPRVDTVYVTRVDTVTITRTRTDTVSAVVRAPDLPVPEVFDPPPSPSFRLFPRGPFTAILTEDMVYEIGSTNERIVIPAGFVTDFASIPRPLWSYLPPTGDYKLAAVVHDYLYWMQPCTKEQSDNLFAIAMAEQGVSSIARAVVYGGVVAGGSASWDANRRDRADSIPRFLSQEQRAIPANATWHEYRRALMARGVRGSPDPVRPVPAYCAYGNSTRVP